MVLDGQPEVINGGIKMSIRFENVVTPSAEQWKAAIMGARNPMNSWDKSDSGYCFLTNLPGSMACHTCKENRNNCGKKRFYYRPKRS